MKYSSLLFFILIRFSCLNAQNCGSSGQAEITEHANISSTCNEMVMTMIEDVMGRRILYVANKEAGLKCYDVSDPDSAKLIKQIKVVGSDNGDVMNVTQSGYYLYLAIGNHFTSGNKAGLAIIDVGNTDSIKLLGKYFLSGSSTGAGAVAVEGNYAYLGAMGSGVVVLDVSDKNNIVQKSVFVPDINYPVKNPSASKYNARGLAVSNSIVYLCYDAGGLRIINCTNKNQPFESGRFANPALYKPVNLARAYNNLIYDDSVVYVAVDYCGVEVLDIKDTSNIKLLAWWNPKNCPNNNWFTSPVHANEIQIDRVNHKLYLSTGKSDMIALNIENPASPDSCNAFGGNSNGIGTWGIHQRLNRLYLSYICTVGIPFSSNWTGVKVLELSYPTAIDRQKVSSLNIFPNPAKDGLTISGTVHFIQPVVNIYNSFGVLLKTIYPETNSMIQIETRELPNGIYFISIQSDGNYLTGEFVVN